MVTAKKRLRLVRSSGSDLEQVLFALHFSRTRKMKLKQNEKLASAKEIYNRAFAHCRIHICLQEPKPLTGLAWGEVRCTH